MNKNKKWTREQKECMSAHCLSVKQWSLLEETEFYLRIINKETKKTKRIDKFRR